LAVIVYRFGFEDNKGSAKLFGLIVSDAVVMGQPFFPPTRKGLIKKSNVTFVTVLSMEFCSTLHGISWW
jgi:hypothetical protein